MEVVNENEESVTMADKRNTLEEERSRMQAAVQTAAHRMAGAPDGPQMPSRKPSLQRVHSGSISRGGASGGAIVGSSRPGSLPLRSQSMRSSVRPLAPTKSTDCLASMRANSVQRAHTSRVLPVRANSSRIGAPRRAPPSRTSSVDSTNSLRAYRRDQIMNTPGMENREMVRLRGPGATLERNTSDLTDMTNGDLSCFTMDSVNLRKTQLVADPIEDGTYNDEDSCADHESVSRASVFSEYTPGMMQQLPGPSKLGVHRTPSRMGQIRFDRMQIAEPKPDESEEDDDEGSFGTLTSGLTTDFTENEFLNSDDEEDDDEELEE